MHGQMLSNYFAHLPILCKEPLTRLLVGGWVLVLVCEPILVLSLGSVEAELSVMKLKWVPSRGLVAVSPTYGCQNFV